MRSRLLLLIAVAVLLLLGGCGSPSKESVMKKLSGKWNDTKGYELQASMEIKTGSEPRVYDVEVWHTKPEFYRVNVSQSGSDDSQMIVRNEEGVFVVTPSLGKTYKFQSDWPAQNSQGYLIGALHDDIKADKNATMEERDGEYVFETATRNNHKKMLPTQRIHINKKTLLPSHVVILDENKEEKIVIKFNKISLGVERKAADYAVEMEEPKAPKETEKGEQPANSKKDKEKTSYQTYYPTVDWEGTTLVDEESMTTENGERLLMTFGGTKEFVVIQEPAAEPLNQLPVSIEGDPVDLGFTVAALTDRSIHWEHGGVSFFVASDTLTKEELITVASSMSTGGAK